MRYHQGVHTVAWATAIRWFGWGLIEALMPVFTYRFTGNYLETALITASFYVFFLLAIPLAGVLADHLSARTILMVSLFIYVFVGVAYFISGINGLVAAMIAARALNGIALSLDVVARMTYLRRHVHKERIASALGYLTTLGNSMWMLALVLSLGLVTIIPLHILFLGISLTAALALWLVWHKLMPDVDEQPLSELKIVRAYKDMYIRMRERRVGLYTLAGLAFALGFMGVITLFLVPLYIYAADQNLRHVVLTTGFVSVPLLLARPIGALADKLQRRAFFIGFPVLIALLTTIPLVPFIVKLVLIFFVGALIELFVLTHASIVTHRVLPERYGRAEGVMQFSSNIGTIVGSAAVGAIIEWGGTDRSFIVLAAVAAATLLFLYLKRRVLTPLHHA